MFYPGLPNEGFYLRKSLTKQANPALQIATNRYGPERIETQREPRVTTIQRRTDSGDNSMNTTNTMSVYDQLEGYTTALIAVMFLIATVAALL